MAATKEASAAGAGQMGLRTEHRDAHGSLGDTVGWILRARAEVASHPMAC